MSVALGMIPYANMAPYRQLGVPRGCHFVPLVPEASIGALLTGRVAAAAVPVVGLARLAGRVEMLGPFGIAAKGPCMSVLFFSRLPFEAMHAPNTVRVTRESATSVQLLHLLLGQTLGFDRLPQRVNASREADAELLIGDRALIQGAATDGRSRFSHVTDLSQVWFERQRLPFVFARWVVRKDAPQWLKRSMGRWLDEFKQKEAGLVAGAVGEAARALDVAPDLIRRYFGAIRRCLDESDIQGQDRFFQEMEPFYRTPLFQCAR